LLEKKDPLLFSRIVRGCFHAILVACIARDIDKLLLLETNVVFFRFFVFDVSCSLKGTRFVELFVCSDRIIYEIFFQEYAHKRTVGCFGHSLDEENASFDRFLFEQKSEEGSCRLCLLFVFMLFKILNCLSFCFSAKKGNGMNQKDAAQKGCFVVLFFDDFLFFHFSFSFDVDLSNMSNPVHEHL
jgi:hypothetical protein